MRKLWNIIIPQPVFFSLIVLTLAASTMASLTELLIVLPIPGEIFIDRRLSSATLGR